MKLKKITMTLALLITAVTGAWAQSSLNVVEFEVPSDWEDDYDDVTAADLPRFYASTLAEAQKWTGAPAEGYAMLIYAFDDDNNAYNVPFVNGTAGFAEDYPMSKALVFEKKSKIYYTVEPTEWSLKPDETGKSWTLAKMPTSNIELQVEYFAESNLFLSKDALADKASIAVKAGELGVQFGEDGKSTTTVTEGTTVTVTYSGSKKVIGVKAEKKSANVHSITIAVDPRTTENEPKATAPAMTIEFNTGETWADVAARYDWLDTFETYTVFYKGNNLQGDVYDANGAVKPVDTIDPNGSYHWGM